MYLLDTNAISELISPRPDLGFTRWLEVQLEHNLSISVLTVAEVRRGIIRARTQRRKETLERWLYEDITVRFQGRMLPVDYDVSMTWGTISEDARLAGQSLPFVDSLIAATALTHGLAVVTRNVGDFVRAGVQVVNPWSGRI